MQLRGEYAYSAGEGGLRVTMSRKLTRRLSGKNNYRAVSRFGRSLGETMSTAVAAPSTLAVEPARWRVKADGTMIGRSVRRD